MKFDKLLMFRLFTTVLSVIPISYIHAETSCRSGLLTEICEPLPTGCMHLYRGGLLGGKVGMCNMSEMYPDWMSEDAAVIRHRPITQLVIPSAHDALMGGGEIDEKIGDIGFFQAGAQSQDMDMLRLLEYGVRSFDLRFCRSQVDDQENNHTLYGCHGGFTIREVTPEAVLEQINEFAEAHPKEVLFLSLKIERCAPGRKVGGTKDQCPNETTDESRAALCELFLDKLEDKLLPPPTADWPLVTLDQIWKDPEGRHIILRHPSVCDEDVRRGELLWTSPSFENIVSASALLPGEPLAGFDIPYGFGNFGTWAQSPFGGFRLRAPFFMEDDIYDSVATANMFDLAETDLVGPGPNGDDVKEAQPTVPYQLHGVQALISNYVAGLASGTFEEWPVDPNGPPGILHNLVNLWSLDRLACDGLPDPNGGVTECGENAHPRSAFNLLHGDFVEHTKLVQLSRIFNAGPQMEVTVIDEHSGQAYNFEPDNALWNRGIEVEIECETYDPANLFNSVVLNVRQVEGEGFEDILGNASPPKTIVMNQSTDTDGQFLNIYCNDETRKFAVKRIGPFLIDVDPPELEGIIADAMPDPTEDQNGNLWYRDPIYYEWDCADELSGLTLESLLDCSGTQMMSSEGYRQTVSLTVFDLAGNSAYGELILNLDMSKPQILARAQPAHNAAGWNNSEVEVTFECSDSLSGIASCTEGQTLSSSTSQQGVTIQGQALDWAGNLETAEVGPIHIDLELPVVELNEPPEAAEYFVGEEIVADWTAHDVLSGIKSIVATIPSGELIDTASAGSKLFEVVAADNADNVRFVTHTYHVLIWPEAIDNLIASIEQMGLGKGVANSLTSKLYNARNAINQQRWRSARGTLSAFINEVEAQTGKRIAIETSEEILSYIQRLLDLMSS